MTGATVRELLGSGRGSVLAFCWLGWVFDFFDLILFSFVKVEVARDLGLGLATDLAWIEGWTLFASAAGGFGFGWLADRHGRRLAITLSILVYSLGACATAQASGFGSLLAARMVTGLGAGGEWGVGHAIVAEAFPPRLRARAAGILQAGSPIAMALAAALACFSGLDWRTLYLLAGLPALLAFFARAALPASSPRREPAADRSMTVPGSALHATLLAILVLHMAGFWCTYAWLPAKLLHEDQASKAFVGWFFVAVNSVHVVADIGFGFLADRCGRKRMLLAFCLCFAAGLTIVAVAHDALRREPLWFLAAFALVGLGAGTWSCFGVLFATYYPERVRATAASGFYNLARGAQLLTQPLMGWLFVATGTFAAALWVGAASAVLSALLVPALPPADAQRTRPAAQ